MAVLEVKNLNKSFGKTKVLSDIESSKDGLIQDKYLLNFRGLAGSAQ